MREIKFRGKRLECELPDGEKLHGGFVYGSLLQGNGLCQILEPIKGGFKSYKVDPDTVGQFTGLHDADGRELYEGDIIERERNGLLYAVIFWEGMYYASVEACNRGIYGGFPLHSLTRDSICRIVGNVHDDPMLLKD